jgi:hypothetical protein
MIFHDGIAGLEYSIERTFHTVSTPFRVCSLAEGPSTFWLFSPQLINSAHAGGR